MTKFEVWSTHVVLKDGAYVSEDRREVTRTDQKVAENDVQIIRDILGRSAWVLK